MKVRLAGCESAQGLLAGEVPPHMGGWGIRNLPASGACRVSQGGNFPEAPECTRETGGTFF
ncbi:MAG TPA: hypothetical protein P5013_03850 [Methanoregula sp.]|nr:hypothetical protein [Methanoregula sp.]